ncbi:Uncharacterized protein Fot_14664 [Forsythia ovata]|uniref:Uncharacterized protein n=1 Tax=Forsythia ovata TaxID=205694 RepID=A0ABD1W6Y8_9LAMI
MSEDNDLSCDGYNCRIEAVSRVRRIPFEEAYFKTHFVPCGILDLFSILEIENTFMNLSTSAFLFPKKIISFRGDESSYNFMANETLSGVNSINANEGAKLGEYGNWSAGSPWSKFRDQFGYAKWSGC